MNQLNITSKYQRRYPGKPKTMLPTSKDKDMKQAVEKNHPTVLPVKQFISTKNLEDLRRLTQERDVWKDILNYICSA